MAEGASAQGPHALGAPRFTQFYFLGAWLDEKRAPKAARSQK